MTTRRLLAAGTVGSVLVAAGGWGSAALPPGVPSRSWGLPLCVVGVLLLSAAWWRLRSRAGLAAVLWGAPLLLAPPLLSRDAYAYVGQAALVVEGLDPYSVGPAALPGPLSEGVDEVWRDVPSPYGPLWLALAAGVVRVTGDHLVAALGGMRLLAVLGLLLAAWALHRLGGERALWLGVANPLVLLHLVGGAHNEALMAGLLLAGLAVPSLPVAAVLITLGALVKLPVLVALGPLVLAVPGLRARVRAGLVVGAVAAVTGVAVHLASGLDLGWVGALDAGRARLSLFSPTTGLGVLLSSLDAVLLAGMLVGLAVGAALLLRTTALGPVAATGWALLAVALLLPVVQPWYLLWGLLPLAAVVRGRTAAALGALSLVLVLLVAPSGRSVVRPPLYGVPTLLAVAAAVLVLRRGRPGPPGVEEDTGARSPRRSETP